MLLAGSRKLFLACSWEPHCSALSQPAVHSLIYSTAFALLTSMLPEAEGWATWHDVGKG